MLSLLTLSYRLQLKRSREKSGKGSRLGDAHIVQAVTALEDWRRNHEHEYRD